LSELNNKALIIKSNKIIEARYKLNPIETKIIMILISLIDRKDSDFKGYKLKVKDVADLIGLKSTNKYSRLKEITGKLGKKGLEIQEDDGLLQVGWLSSTKYYKDGMIKFSFDPQLKPYLLELKGNFTSYLLKNILSLENEHSPRIYALLKQYESIGKRSIELKELRVILGIEEFQYKLYGDFKRYVLKVSQKDIERNTDIKFEFKEVKTGRKVTSIVFIIHSNKAVKSIEDNNIEIFDNLKSLGLNDKKITSILKNHKKEVIQQVLDNYYALSENYLNTVDSKTGLFLSMFPEPGKECPPSQEFLDKQKKEKESKLIEKQIAETRKREKLKDIQTKLEREHTRLVDGKIEKTINKLSKKELEAFEQEYLDDANNFEVTQFKKGLRRSFNIFMGKKLLEPDVLDFGKFAKDKGYNVKKNKGGKFELSEI